MCIILYIIYFLFLLFIMFLLCNIEQYIYIYFYLTLFSPDLTLFSLPMFCPTEFSYQCFVPLDFLWNVFNEAVVNKSFILL